ncbi:MAG: hypothetical protein IKA05_02040 [Clostridia bacterium]|nr:hypothetical protein [Clostridia bacterium]
MEIPIFDFENADVKIIFMEEYSCKTDTERLDIALEVDEEIKEIIHTNSFLKKQSQKRQQDITELIALVSRIAIIQNAKIKLLLSKSLKTLSIELSAPELTFDKKGLALLMEAFLLCSDVGFYPSLENKLDGVITFDYFFFGEKNTLINDIQYTIRKMQEL